MKNAYLAPLRGAEADQLRFVFFLRKSLLENHHLDGRLKGMGKLWRWRGVTAQLDHLVHDVAGTIPPEIWERFRRTMDMQELHVSTRGGAVDPTGDLMVVPRKALLKILATASKECMLCDGEPDDRRKCPYRKAVKEMVLTDLSLAEDDGICMGKKFDWEGN